MRSNQLVRVYPIRMTTREWDIPLHCYHICNNRCRQMYTRDYTDTTTIRYILTDNPDYNEIEHKCPKFNQIEKTVIPLCSYQTNSLYCPDMKVIPDNEFVIRFTFPLSCDVDTIINTQLNGFTLRELLNIIKQIYIYIYEEEERTSTQLSYRIKNDCETCEGKNVHNYITKLKLDEKESEKDCSICYNNYTENNDIGQIVCKHYYHTECILRWFENSKTCPLCRKYVIDCDECDGGVIYSEYNGAVIPLEYREDNLHRNNTDGVFGIYGYDFEDLFIEHMQYNRIKKILTLDIYAI